MEIFFLNLKFSKPGERESFLKKKAPGDFSLKRLLKSQKRLKSQGVSLLVQTRILVN